MTRPVSAPSTPTDTPNTEVPVNNPETPSVPSTTGTQTFSIVSARSEAKFEINEVLNNKPFRVVGTTNAITGNIIIDLATPANSSVGTISINARTLKTDSSMRDGMIGRMILKSEANEFITFTPKSFSGLPTETPKVGQEYSFTTTGTLTIAGTSKEVTFSVRAKANTESEIQGVATSSINYPDYSITIPKVPKVASVEDKVDLTFSFVAVKR